MSLIHEALQKAESERRAGELPPLLSVNTPIARQRRSYLPALAACVGLALLTAAAYSNRGLILQTVGVPGAEPARAPSPVVAEPVAVAQEEIRKPVSAARATANKPGALRNEPIVDAAALVDVSRQPAFPAVPAPIPLPRSNPSEPVQAEVQAPALAEVPTNKPMDPEPVEPGPSITAEPPPVEAQEPSPAKPDAPASSQIDAVPYMFELPLSTRQALPALKVTMHVYSTDSSKRFAIIDGKRVNDGGILGNDLNVVEIQREAILIDFRGTRFLMPRLGR